MLRSRWLIGVAAAGCAVAPRALAQDLFEKHFAKADEDAPCYMRAYDDAHMAAHPMQKVARIAIDMSRDNLSGAANMPASFELGFALRTRDRPDWYTALAICKSRGSSVSCFIEGDGGRFGITALTPDHLRLEAGNYGIAIEGAKDFIEPPGSNGDDRAFILQRAVRAMCDAQTASPAAK